MTQGWYRKQKRYFAVQDRERFTQVHGFHVKWGSLPGVYHVGHGTFWVPKHYYSVVALMLGAGGAKWAQYMLDALPLEWWQKLDAYAEHVQVLAAVPDDPLGITLWGWLADVNPHVAMTGPRPLPF